MNLDEKKCPKCGEVIKAVAIKCKYCSSVLNDENKNSGKFYNRYALLLYPLLFAFGMLISYLFFLKTNPEPLPMNSQTSNISDQSMVRPNASNNLSANQVKKCMGTEPFWDLDIGQSQIQFTDEGNNTKMTISKTTPSTAIGSSSEYITLYQGKTIEKNDRFMNIIITKIDNCSDGMSTNEYPFSAHILSGKNLYTGCCN